MGVNLIGQAATGSIEAHSMLVDVALDALASGCVRQTEALMSAEIWARLAASIGGETEQRTLLNILVARSEFEEHRGGDYAARWYRTEASRIRASLSTDRSITPNERVPCQLAAAAAGDVSVLASLCDDAIRIAHSGRANQVEALTAAEAYARLAASSGAVEHVTRLADTLILRARYEYREGWRELGDNVEAEALILVGQLADQDAPAMADAFDQLTRGVVRPAVSIAVICHPALLTRLQPQGRC